MLISYKIFITCLMVNSIICLNQQSSLNGFDNDQSPSNSQIKLGPQEMMVDLTNHFALKVLYLHSIQNKNNFAFSPCGLASVLIALYEGSDGKSAIEIHQALELPWERDLTRVGFRDIHRRLRTYFYHQENILSGLSLSRENVTIRPEYETILRFYGYEVEAISNQYNKEGEESIAVEDEKESRESTIADTEATTIEITTEDITTTTEEEETTEQITTTTEEPTTTNSPPETTTEEIRTTTLEPQTTTYILKYKPTTTRIPEDTTPYSTLPITYPTRIPVAIANDAASASAVPRVPRPSRGSRLYQYRARRSTPRNFTNIMRLPRSPMEYEITGYDITPNYFFQATPNPGGLNHHHHHQNQQQFFGFDYESTKVARPPPHDETQEETVIHFFYLNHYETIQVPYKFYNTILKYAYVEAIRSSVLELQLDSENYNMMIVLPDYEYGLENLVASLKSHYAPSLREIRQQMRPAWVKAIVPKFSLKGNIVLTSDLQNMGIHDIFEPTHADFTPMTEEELVYARHVEQSVTVNIRTQSMEQLKRQASFYKSPVEISINHPFLFFIVDTEIDLGIITGRILNPINSRIQ